MIKSMTGYGKSSVVLPSKEISVEVKSVNHRYLDLSYKIPKFLSFAEERIRAAVAGYAQRGKIDVYISVISGEESGKTVVLDKELAKQYITAFKELSEMTGVTYDLSVSDFMNSEIVKVEHPEQEEDEIWAEIAPVLDACLTEYASMCAREGERLKTDIIEKAESLLTYVAHIEQIIPQNIEAYKTRLLTKIREAIGDLNIDETRILTEVAIYVDKTCVDEEIVRLKSHVTELKHILTQGGVIGKKLDFLIQEMNREVNTLGSKSNDLKITADVIEMKTVLEKIREQIQNIE